VTDSRATRPEDVPPAVSSLLVRSVLFVPGDDERKIAKAATSPADGLIVDLEDAVAVSRKAIAASMLATTLATLATHRTFVRINALDTGRAAEDIAAVTGAGGFGIVVPKVRDPDDIAEIEHLVSAAGPVITTVIPLVESARAVADIAGIAACSPMVERLAFGSADFSRDLDIDIGDEPGSSLVLNTVRALLVLGSRTAEVGSPLDGPMLDVRDQAGFRTYCTRSRGMGFGGVLCLHPDQVTVANDVFAPSAEAIARAQRIVDAFAESEQAGAASITVDGAFVDYPIAEAARVVLARADAITRSRR
jgi:citrate lyase subunit beta / citryl-CoA lyase